MSQGELESLLQALREESRGVEAPARVEVALRAALRARARTRQRWLWAAAAAVVLMSGAAAVWIVSGKPQVQQQAPVAIRTLPDAPVQPAVTAKIAPPVVARRAPRRVHVPPPRPLEEVTTEFLPLDETIDLPPIESAQVVRVRVPQGTLVRFGVPVNEDRMLVPIQADVVFAQDGIARAIRFVNYKGER